MVVYTIKQEFAIVVTTFIPPQTFIKQVHPASVATVQQVVVVLVIKQYFVKVLAAKKVDFASCSAIPIFAAIHNFTEALATSAFIEVAEHKVKALMEVVAELASPMIRCVPQSQ